jgi:cysteine synthase A
MSSIAFLEANSTGTAYNAMKLAKNRGLKIVFLTNESDFYKSLPENPLTISDEVIEVDSYDPISILTALDGRALEGIIAFDDYRLPIAAVCAASLGLPTGSISSLLKVRFKELTRKFFEGTDNSVDFRIIKNYSIKSVNFSSLKFPVIVKPTDESGSVSIQKVDTLEDLVEHVSNVPRSVVNIRGYCRSNNLLVEQYIEGKEFSCELFFDSQTNIWFPLGITEKIPDESAAHVEAAHVFPADLESSIYDDFMNTIVSWLGSIELSSGAAHVEFKVDLDGKLRLIEINPRLPGGHITELVKITTGVDQLAKYFDFHLKSPLFIEDEKSEFSEHPVAATVYFSSREIFSLSQVGRFQTFLDNCDFVNSHRFGSIPSSIPYEPKSNYDRFGYAIIVALSHGELRTRLALVRDELKNSNT